MNPYIHLFRSPNRCYVYDVNKDSVLTVSDSLYAYLEACKDVPDNTDSIEELGHEDREALRSMLEAGYLSDHRVERIEHFHTSDLDFQLHNRINEMVLQVTQACNLVCSYCPFANKTDDAYQRNHSSKRMTWETAKKSIDLFVDYSAEMEEVGIGFYGGEPFLNFGLIRQVVTYADQVMVGKKITYSLTTNGTMLTDEIIAFLAEHNFRMMVSIDGPASIHDINRRKADGSGSYHQAVSSLKKLSAAFGDRSYERLMINTVVNPETDFDEVLHLFDDPFFLAKKVRIAVTLASDDKLEKPLESRDDFFEKFNYNRFVSMMKLLGVLKDIEIDPISEQFILLLLDKTTWDDKETPLLGSVSAPAGPCIPGQRKLFVNADGIFYPCERVNELSEDVQMGNVTDGIDLKKADRILNIAQLTENECKKCYAFRHCSICAVTASDGNGFSVAQKLRRCIKVKSKFNNTLRLIALKKEIDTVYKRNLIL